MSKLNPNHYTPESWKALEDKIAEGILNGEISKNEDKIIFK